MKTIPIATAPLAPVSRERKRQAPKGRRVDPAALARELARVVRTTGRIFVLTQNNTGYPLVRQARQMVADGTLGSIQVIRVSYVQDWLTTDVDAHGQISRAQAADLCALAPDQASRLLRRLAQRGELIRRGERRGSVYTRPIDSVG